MSDSILRLTEWQGELMIAIGDNWKSAIMINREQAKLLAEVLERFARTGRVDDDAERAEVPHD